MFLNLAMILHNQVSSRCPIERVVIGKQDDKSTWLIEFKSDATSPQRSSAQIIINNFDVVKEEIKSKPFTFEERLDILETKVI